MIRGNEVCASVHNFFPIVISSNRGSALIHPSIYPSNHPSLRPSIRPTERQLRKTSDDRNAWKSKKFILWKWKSTPSHRRTRLSIYKVANIANVHWSIRPLLHSSVGFCDEWWRWLTLAIGKTHRLRAKKFHHLSVKKMIIKMNATFLECSPRGTMKTRRMRWSNFWKEKHWLITRLKIFRKIGW